MADYYTELTQETSESNPVQNKSNYYSEIMAEQDALYSHPENTPAGQFSPGTLPQNEISPLSSEQEARKLPIEQVKDSSVIESVKQGFVDNPQSKIKRFAEARFPNDPNAINKYGIVDGNVVYYDEETGTLKAEQGTIENVVEGVTRMTPATVGGIVGGITGNVPGAATGGAGGEAWRKTIGMALGDEQTSMGNLTDLAVEGVLNAAGWKLGNLGGSKVVDRRVVSDIAKFDKEKTQNLINIAKEHGVDLTPAEASDLGSLISQQTRLGMSFDEAGDLIRKFYQDRAKQVDDAVNNFVGETPPSSVAGAEARDAAGNIIKKAKDARSAEARPLYESVVNKENLVHTKNTIDESYKITHTAPTKEGKNSLDDLEDIFPDDIYDPKVSGQYYGHGEPILDRQTANIISKLKGNPEKEITIYRAVPKGTKNINPGDWVTVNKNYAKNHGDSWVDDGVYDVIEKKVRVKDLTTDGNSIHEWGYSPDVIKELPEIFSDPFIKKEILKVNKSADDFYKLNDAPDNSLAVIDQVKKNLDDQIKVAQRAGKNNEARLIQQRKDQLVKEADSAFPEYKTARESFAGKSPEIDELEQGIVGVLANVKDPALLKSADKIFKAENIDPHDVMKLHTQFKNSGHTKEWDQFLNSFLRKQWESIKPTQGGNDFGKGANFKKMIFGSKRQQEVMEAAMGGKRYKMFKDLMDVLEATGKVPKGQSMTEPAQQAARQEALDVAPIATYAKEFDVTKPASWFNLDNWWINAKTKDWQAQIAKVITSPQSVKELEKLRKLKSLSPNQQNAINVVSTAIIRGLGLSAEKELSGSTEQMPPVLNQLDNLKAL